VSEALAFVAAVRAVGIEVRWFETDPLAHGLPAAFRDVRLRGTSRSPRGSRRFSRVGMRELMARSIDVSNFDASWVGGLPNGDGCRACGEASTFRSVITRAQIGGSPPCVGSARHRCGGVLTERDPNLLEHEIRPPPSSSMATSRSRRRPGLAGNSTPRSSHATGSMP